jgi:hypothetical protein
MYMKSSRHPPAPLEFKDHRLQPRDDVEVTLSLRITIPELVFGAGRELAGRFRLDLSVTKIR